MMVQFLSYECILVQWALGLDFLYCTHIRTTHYLFCTHILFIQNYHLFCQIQ